MTARTRPRITLPIQIGYGLGDFACNAVWATGISFMAYYYTDVFHIPAELVAILVLVSRVASAVIDPAVGFMLDKYDGVEKARPFIKWGAIPLAMTVALMFVPLGSTVTEKFIWALATMLAMTIAYSVVNTAYGILPNLITLDTTDRLGLTSSRFIGASLAGMLVGGITLSCVAALGHGNRQLGFSLFMAIVGASVGLCLLVTWYLCRENVTVRREQNSGGIAHFRALFNNTPWLILIIIKILNAIANAMTIGAIIYECLYVLKLGESFVGTLMATSSIAAFVGCCIAPAIGKRLGGRATVRGSNICQVLCFVMIASLPPNGPLTLVLISIAGFLTGVRDPVVYAMLSNCIDYGNSRSGIAAIGSGYAVASAAVKIATGLGTALLAILLARSGYVAGTAEQTVAARTAIGLAFAVIPGVILLLSTLASFAYPHDDVIEHGKLSPLLVV